jgi:hypothetical protein
MRISGSAVYTLVPVFEDVVENFGSILEQRRCGTALPASEDFQEFHIKEFW